MNHAQPMYPVRCLIVDDEPLGRERIRILLSREADFEVIGEAADGEEAVAAIQHLQPELVFLDIQMPELDGFGVVERVGVDRMPLTIFVTAYDQHALRAFEAHAFDYLLKPVDPERFERALTRIRKLRREPQGEGMAEKLKRLLQSLNGDHYPERFVIRSGPRHFVINVDEIDFVTAEGNYLRIHAGGITHLLRDTMTNFATKLDPNEFVRIHRSTIVRIRNIASLESVFQGEYVVTLKNGTKLPSSRTYREDLERAISLSS